MSITPEQLEQIRNWAAQGIDLNGIQKNLSDAGISMRFMELRFLLLDNEIEIAEPKPAEEPKEDAKPEDAPAPAAGDGSTHVSIDEIKIPGTMISGKALFPSGIQGAWQFDMQGQFGWTQLTGEPNDQELRAFQVELSKLLGQG